MVFGPPQVIMVVMMAVSVILAGLKHGEERPPWDFPAAGLSVAIVFGLLVWGGFLGGTR